MKKLLKILLNKKKIIYYGKFTSPVNLFYKKKSFFIKDYWLKMKMMKTKDIILSKKSGLMKPQESFYETDKDQLSKIIDYSLLTILTKNKIENPYGLGLAISNSLKYNKNLNLVHDNYYPILQHTLVGFFNSIKFPKEILEKITKNQIDYSSFPEYVEVSSVIEAKVIYETMGKFLEENQETIKAYAQYNLNKDTDYYKEESYKQTGQPHADLRIEFLDSSIKKKIFMDVKLKTDPIKNVPLLKGSLSLSIDIKKEKYIEKLSGDSKYAFFDKSKKNIKENEALNNLLKDICSLKNDQKISLDERFEGISRLLKSSLLNPDINNITFSFIVDFSSKENNFLPLSYETIINKEKLFIKDGKSLNISEWKKLYKDKVMKMAEIEANKEIKFLILENYKRIEYF